MENIPFARDSFDFPIQRRLEDLGAKLWEILQEHRIVSVNRGRQTVAFRPLACTNEREEIDQILVKAAKLPKSFVHTLRAFVEHIVVVDSADMRRSHLKNFFKSPEVCK